MAINRWFSYNKCVPKHLPCWHCRLLMILMLGMRLGLYRDRKEFPMWGGLPRQRGQEEAPEVGEEGEEEVQEEMAAAVEEVKVSSTAAHALGLNASVAAGERDVKTLQMDCRTPSSWQRQSWGRSSW